MFTLLDFYADWCGPCHAMAPILHKVVEEMKDRISLEKVNVDENQQKSSEYGIMSIPTLVLLNDGKEIARKTGLLPEAALKQWLESSIR